MIDNRTTIYLKKEFQHELDVDEPNLPKKMAVWFQRGSCGPKIHANKCGWWTGIVIERPFAQ